MSWNHESVKCLKKIETIFIFNILFLIEYFLYWGCILVIHSITILRIVLIFDLILTYVLMNKIPILNPLQSARLLPEKGSIVFFCFLFCFCFSFFSQTVFDPLQIINSTTQSVLISSKNAFLSLLTFNIQILKKNIWNMN